MNAKDWLNRAYKLDKEIDSLEAAKRTMYNRITGITPNYGGEVVNGTKDPHKYDEYVAYCAKVDKLVDEYVDIKCEIHTIIAQIKDTKLRTILLARYINFLTFEQIAVDMSYDWRHIMRLHKQALAEVEKLIMS